MHRDICPQNLMFDSNTNHIKLIDFGCAINYDINDKIGSIEIKGTTIYGALKFLDFYSKLLTGVYLPYYEYERTFDLESTLNVIICMSNAKVKEKIYSIEIIIDNQERISKIIEFWKDMERNNQHYSYLVNLLNECDELSTFDILKDKIKEFFNK